MNSQDKIRAILEEIRTKCGDAIMDNPTNDLAMDCRTLATKAVMALDTPEPTAEPVGWTTQLALDCSEANAGTPFGVLDMCSRNLWADKGVPLYAHPPADSMEASIDTRDRECVSRWPECSDGDYNPNCCRFPKSCSCGN